MNDNNLTPSDLKDFADHYRSIARDIQNVRIPRLQSELATMINAGANGTQISEQRNLIQECVASATECITTATELDSKAILAELTSTEVENAKNTIICATAKVKLAVNKINEIKSVLRFVAAFINLGAAIISAIPSSGISFANIGALIEAIDNLTEQEISGNLSDEEKEQLKNLLSQCLPPVLN